MAPEQRNPWDSPRAQSASAKQIYANQAILRDQVELHYNTASKIWCSVPYWVVEICGWDLLHTWEL